MLLSTTPTSAESPTISGNTRPLLSNLLSSVLRTLCGFTSLPYRSSFDHTECFVSSSYEQSDCLVGVHRNQDVNSSKTLTLDLRPVSSSTIERRHRELAHWTIPLYSTRNREFCLGPLISNSRTTFKNSGCIDTKLQTLVGTNYDIGAFNYWYWLAQFLLIPPHSAVNSLASPAALHANIHIMQYCV